MIAEFTVIGDVVRSSELKSGDRTIFRFNVVVRMPDSKGRYKSMYINNITIWNPNAIELAKKKMIPGTTVFVRGNIQTVSSSRQKGLKTDIIYFNASTFFVLKKGEKQQEEDKYKREIGDFMSVDTDYMLFPGESEKDEGYYPTYVGDEADNEGSYDIPEEPEE